MMRITPDLKIIFFSSNRIVFDPIFFIDEPCWVCKKSMLIVAELGQSLRCFKCGAGMADSLCVFCESGIAQIMRSAAGEPSCLKGHSDGCVKFCADFSPGPNFGADWKKDIGERKTRAEEVFSKVIIECCNLCCHRNTDNVVKMEQTPDADERREYAGVIRGGGKVKGYLYLDHDASFCELGKKSFRKRVVCSSFEPSQHSKQFYEHSKTALPKYVEALKFLELLFPPEQSACEHC